MTRVSKGFFCDELCRYPSVFGGAYYRRDDVWLTEALERVGKLPGGFQTRTVRERRPTKLIFSNGSAVSLNSSAGVRVSYFSHTNAAGTRFLVQRLHSVDLPADEENLSTYLVYIL